MASTFKGCVNNYRTITAVFHGAQYINKVVVVFACCLPYLCDFFIKCFRFLSHFLFCPSFCPLQDLLFSVGVMDADLLANAKELDLLKVRTTIIYLMQIKKSK